MNERKSAQRRGTRQNAIISYSEMFYIFPLGDGKALLYDFVKMRC